MTNQAFFEVHIPNLIKHFIRHFHFTQLPHNVPKCQSNFPGGNRCQLILTLRFPSIIHYRDVIMARWRLKSPSGHIGIGMKKIFPWEIYHCTKGVSWRLKSLATPIFVQKWQVVWKGFPSHDVTCRIPHVARGICTHSFILFIFSVNILSSRYTYMVAPYMIWIPCQLRMWYEFKFKCFIFPTEIHVMIWVWAYVMQSIYLWRKDIIALICIISIYWNVTIYDISNQQ